MHAMIRRIDALNTGLGEAVAWLTLGMVILMAVTVAQRYLFQSGYPWEQELVGFMHAAVFLFGAGYTARRDGHVRVDILYQRFSPAGRAWVDLAGTVLFLFPVCLAIIWTSWGFVTESWKLREGSNEYLGMPGVYLLKTCIWAFAGVVALQGVATVLRALSVLHGAPYPKDTDAGVAAHETAEGDAPHG